MLLNVLVGLLIRLTGGKEAVDKVLPPIITGSVACTIGIGLGYTALTMASGTCCGVDPAAAPSMTLTWWAVSFITLVATVLYSVYLQGKGFIGMLPIMLGGTHWLHRRRSLWITPTRWHLHIQRLHSAPCNLPELRQSIDWNSSLGCRYYGYCDHPGINSSPISDLTLC